MRGLRQQQHGERRGLPLRQEGLLQGQQEHGGSCFLPRGAPLGRQALTRTVHTQARPMHLCSGPPRGHMFVPVAPEGGQGKPRHPVFLTPKSLLPPTLGPADPLSQAQDLQIVSPGPAGPLPTCRIELQGKDPEWRWSPHTNTTPHAGGPSWGSLGPPPRGVLDHPPRAPGGGTHSP